MAETPSTMVDLGSKAPDFRLPDTDGRMVSLGDFEGAPALLVVFICNHCPFVKHIRFGLAHFAEDTGSAAWRWSGSTRTTSPATRPTRRTDGGGEEDGRLHLPLPVRRDPGGREGLPRRLHAGLLPLRPGPPLWSIAGSSTTAAPSNGEPVTGADLRAAADDVLAGEPVPADQKPSIGCNIKWKPGNAPHYYVQ